VYIFDKSRFFWYFFFCILPRILWGIRRRLVKIRLSDRSLFLSIFILSMLLFIFYVVLLNIAYSFLPKHSELLFFFTTLPILSGGEGYLVLIISRRETKNRWRLQGKCHHCGYDLRESKGVCPECGTRITKHSAETMKGDLS